MKHQREAVTERPSELLSPAAQRRCRRIATSLKRMARGGIRTAKATPDRSRFCVRRTYKAHRRPEFFCCLEERESLRTVRAGSNFFIDSVVLLVAKAGQVLAAYMAVKPRASAPPLSGAAAILA